jgi:hypothetical protein
MKRIDLTREVYELFVEICPVVTVHAPVFFLRNCRKGIDRRIRS